MLLSLSDMTCMETNPEVLCATRLMVFCAGSDASYIHRWLMSLCNKARRARACERASARLVGARSVLLEGNVNDHTACMNMSDATPPMYPSPEIGQTDEQRDEVT